MRAIICLFLLFSFIGKVYGQVPSQKEMQAQMKLVIDELNNQIIELEKQIADAKKKKEDPETIKEMEDQLEMLRKQIEMMGGVTHLFCSNIFFLVSGAPTASLRLVIK